MTDNRISRTVALTDGRAALVWELRIFGRTLKFGVKMPFFGDVGWMVPPERFILSLRRADVPFAIDVQILEKTKWNT